MESSVVLQCLDFLLVWVCGFESLTDWEIHEKMKYENKKLEENQSQKIMEGMKTR